MDADLEHAVLRTGYAKLNVVAEFRKCGLRANV
jgi:hypothetical protein